MVSGLQSRGERRWRPQPPWVGETQLRRGARGCWVTGQSSYGFSTTSGGHSVLRGLPCSWNRTLFSVCRWGQVALLHDNQCLSNTQPEQEFFCSPDVWDSQAPEPWPLTSVSMRDSRWCVELSEAAEGTKWWAGVSPGRPYKRQVDRVLRPQPFPGVPAQGQPWPCWWGVTQGPGLSASQLQGTPGPSAQSSKLCRCSLGAVAPCSPLIHTLLSKGE